MRTSYLLVSSLVLTVAGCQAPDASGTPAAQQTAGAESDSTPESVVASGPLSAKVTEAALGAEARSAQTSSQSQDAKAAMRRNQERQKFLADTHIDLGNAQLEALNLAGALDEFAQALEIMPTNTEARDLVRHVRGLMGDEYANVAEAFDDMVERERVRQAIARLDVDQYTLDGDNSILAGDFVAAIEWYRRAEMILRYNPLISTQSLDEQILANKLQSAVEGADKQRAEREEGARMAADRERAVADKAQSEYRAEKLLQLYTQANTAFQAEKYSLAETLANQILLYDPGNEYATKMANISTAARHQSIAEKNARTYQETWSDTFDELNQLGLIQTSTVKFDLNRWREVRKRKPYEFASTRADEDGEKDAILAILAEKRVPARFGVDGDGAPLEEVADYLQSISGVNFIISPKVTDELDADETAVLLDLPDRSVLSLLNIITEVKEGLRWKIEDGVVKFVTAEELTGGQVLIFYEVRDLINPIRDFPGREINISPSGGVPEIDEEIEEREALVLIEEDLDTLIHENVAPDSWDADVLNSLTFSSGTMIVNQTPEVHAQIAALLEDLREATGIMVDIQANFLKVEDNFLEDIGVDFRGLGAPGGGTNNFFNDFGNASAQQTLGGEIGSNRDLGAFFNEGEDGDIGARTENLFDQFLGDEDVLTGSGGLQFQWVYLNDLQLEMILTAVSKSERIELVTAPGILVYNTARSNLSVMNQVAYVQDFNVEIAQAASIADPIVSVVEDGVVLDVRPVVSADRRFITLELRPTVAQLRRPIATFTTSLGVSGNSVTIQLPELDISRVRTSIPMPDGSTVLLGGMKVHEEEEFRSGVPILNKIPILSFFFERQGTFITNRKLLMLIKAKIVILAESEPSEAQLGLDKSLQLDPR